MRAGRRKAGKGKQLSATSTWNLWGCAFFGGVQHGPLATTRAAKRATDGPWPTDKRPMPSGLSPSVRNLDCRAIALNFLARRRNLEYSVRAIARVFRQRVAEQNSE
jgi:hypothetical protein